MGSLRKLTVSVLAVVALASPALAQSGVISGPPQVKVEPVWIAVAGGFDGNGRNVGVGFSGRRDTRDGAEEAALRACRDNGRGVRCREAHATESGCLYIVAGNRARRRDLGQGRDARWRTERVPPRWLYLQQRSGPSVVVCRKIKAGHESHSDNSYGLRGGRAPGGNADLGG